jgi:hypothetical protein
MKTALFLIIASTVFMAACKKSFKCTCITTSTQVGFDGDTTIVDYTGTKGAAKSRCALYANDNGGKLIWSETIYFPAAGGNPAYTVTTTCGLE